MERILDARRVLAHIRSSRSPSNGVAIRLEDGSVCTVLCRQDNLFVVRFDGDEDIEGILQRIGHTPLPPYITRPDDYRDKQRYQTVYAEKSGAAAAPTAGLHFDLPLIDRLRAKRVDVGYVTLHVGSGTFQPVRAENLADHRIHQEYYEVGRVVARKVAETRARGNRVVAVGTTSVRALESAVRDGHLRPSRGETSLFILPGYRFSCIDALVTNFHLPESTLLTLVCAFAGYQPVMAAYRHAVERRYRFFSYGDAMFVTRKE